MTSNEVADLEDCSIERKGQLESEVFKAEDEELALPDESDGIMSTAESGFQLTESDDLEEDNGENRLNEENPLVTGDSKGSNATQQYFLRWSRLCKTVQVQEANAGLLRSSIAGPSTSSFRLDSRDDVGTGKEEGQGAASTTNKKTILNLYLDLPLLVKFWH